MLRIESLSARVKEGPEILRGITLAAGLHLGSDQADGLQRSIATFLM